ncbi:endonuclease domain-containing protein [Streptomyces sp. 8N616]|uniref:endonuclease domain-containing protein n=1 Tax=Streptomyces sp. 8N616 TaxID=3457414 RepID=UPI003FD1D162
MHAIQLMHPDMVASHRSAAGLLGIELLRPGLEVTRVGGVRHGRPLGATAYQLPLDEAEVIRLNCGLRVTNPLRTVVDLLRSAPLDESVVAADSALRQRSVERDRLTDALRMSCWRKGTSAAWKALRLTDPAAGSPPETLARLRMREAGMHPESQVSFTLPDGRTVRVDFYFPAEGLIVEIEGFTWHGTKQAHEADAVRFNALLGCQGVRRLLRFTRNQVLFQPQTVVRTIQRALVDLREGG